MSILDRAQRASHEVTARHINLLVYGMPGSGKTYLARTAADAGLRVLVLDGESGRMTLAGSTVDVLPIEDVARDLDNAIVALRAQPRRYDVVVVDTLTELQKRYADDLRRELELAGKLKEGKLRLADWGTIIDWTRRVCRAFRDLPCSVVITTHSKELESEADGDAPSLRIRPSLQGKTLPHEVAGFFDLVAYSFKVKRDDRVAYCLAFNYAGEKHCVKDRTGLLADVEPSDLGALLAKVRGVAEGAVPAVDERARGRDSTPAAPRPAPSRAIPSASRPDVEHEVTVDENGVAVACTCEGFRFNKKCRHLAEAAIELAEDLVALPGVGRANALRLTREGITSAEVLRTFLAADPAKVEEFIGETDTLQLLVHFGYHTWPATPQFIRDRLRWLAREARRRGTPRDQVQSEVVVTLLDDVGAQMGLCASEVEARVGELAGDQVLELDSEQLIGAVSKLLEQREGAAA